MSNLRVVMDWTLKSRATQYRGDVAKARHPQTNGICGRFHKTILQEFYQVAFRKKLYLALDELQADLDAWLFYYNKERTHQGKMCSGRTPLQTFIEGKSEWRERSTS
ncbi:hypothetical protein BI347_10065 [Chromobacterium sphagni]|uniref:Integrase catalytic domain-containing protein n=1 Tax=Chromobacterium sphagni TaxID=1903179 RepID=A0A1S1X325_9NEIS|nr:hypothetical protein BI347_10065 [Chromobacterium sphagni]OHX20838.1 hypothetical protein BI344_14020 [Chromobacterium sphagni]